MQHELDKHLDLPKDTLEGKAKDHEIIGTKQNMFCSAHISPSGLYKENYDKIRWITDALKEGGALMTSTTGEMYREKL